VPHHKSAKKRVRQTLTRTLRNKIKTTQARSAEKKLRGLVAEGNKDEAAKLLPETQSLYAKMAKKGIIKPNTAARKASRLTNLVKNA
jgi:small subunit ribosomal protein S20